MMHNDNRNDSNNRHMAVCLLAKHLTRANRAQNSNKYTRKTSARAVHAHQQTTLLGQTVSAKGSFSAFFSTRYT
jgi:hypothetical protein